MTTRTGDDAVWAFAEREHHELGRGLNRLHEVASEMGHRPPIEFSTHVLGVLEWLRVTLEPHMAWEEAVLYPEIDERAGTPWATRSARLEHRLVRSRIERLRGDWLRMHDSSRPEWQRAALADLSALEGQLRTHIEVEEQLLIPVLAESTAIEPESVAAPTPVG